LGGGNSKEQFVKWLHYIVLYPKQNILIIKNSSSFHTARNTLEAKQFFKSRTAIREFVVSSMDQKYDPPYTRLLILTLNDSMLSEVSYDEMDLDGFEAISVPEDELPAFNKSVTFVKEEML
jgi:hypothetical protein